VRLDSPARLARCLRSLRAMLSKSRSAATARCPRDQSRQSCEPSRDRASAKQHTPHHRQQIRPIEREKSAAQRAEVPSPGVIGVNRTNPGPFRRENAPRKKKKSPSVSILERMCDQTRAAQEQPAAIQHLAKLHTTRFTQFRVRTRVVQPAPRDRSGRSCVSERLRTDQPPSQRTCAFRLRKPRRPASTANGGVKPCAPELSICDPRRRSIASRAAPAS